MNYLLGLALVIIMGIVGLGFYNDSQANRIRAEAQAQATIIRAEAQARKDNAQAYALEMAALTPFTMIVMFGIAAAIGGIGVVIFAIKYQPGRPQVIERITERTIVYLPSGPRREVWQQLSSGKPAMILNSQNEREL